MPRKSQYTDQQIEEAKKLYEEVGPSEASRRTGINKSTIASWARRSDLQTDAPTNLRAATEMAQLTRQQQRQQQRDEICDEILLNVRARLKQMNELTTIVTNAAGNTVKVPVSPDGQAKLSLSIKNLMETLRLELGEVTSRTETIGRSDKEQKLAEIIGLNKKAG